jgi:hypothetical protein
LAELEDSEDMLYMWDAMTYSIDVEVAENGVVSSLLIVKEPLPKRSDATASLRMRDVCAKSIEMVYSTQVYTVEHQPRS